MKKLIYVSTLSMLLLAACSDDTTDTADTSKENEVTKVETETESQDTTITNEVDDSIMSDTTKPFDERLTELATQLFGTETTTGDARNITVDSMGDMYYLKLMIDDAVTMDATLDRAQRQTIELLKHAKDAEGYSAINVNWQGNFSSGEIGSAVTVMFTKEDLDKIDLEKLKPNELEKSATNYGTHSSFK